MVTIAEFEKVSRERFLADTADLSADYSDLRLPVRATAGSAGYDFFLPFSLFLASGKTAVIPTGIRVRIEQGWFLLIAPRSGLGFKYRLRLDNTVGIIDSDYYYSPCEGHIFVKLTNESEKELSLDKGAAFCQGIFLPYGIAAGDSADSIRQGGLGSTG